MDENGNIYLRPIGRNQATRFTGGSNYIKQL